ncbi:MAG: A/G-specific adenine glycosylase [Erysipelotrichaceae bacterium]|nr:A/G-specific adenine glycosylase [Erysipelotrichaceae bacterium]
MEYNRAVNPFRLEDAAALCAWYRENKRALPWRDTGDPYDVWISEIMLQQTRIEAVREKYLRFKKELPDIPSLAACKEDELMRLWEGLGYYSRARNLKKCAEKLVQEYDGLLPADHQKLLSLPGIGPYTAGAIASIAFGLPCPAIDGNVLRVLTRFCGITEDVRLPATENAVREQLLPLYGNDVSSGDLNQGLMELGETLCLPKDNPHCENCPLQKHCFASQNGMTTKIPFRSSLKRRRIIKRTLTVIRQGDRFLLKKRPAKGLLAGLYEFPGIDEELGIHDLEERMKEAGLEIASIFPLPSGIHVFSHLEWHMQAYEVNVTGIGENFKGEDWLLLSREELQEKAIPSAFRTWVKHYSLRKEAE